MQLILKRQCKGHYVNRVGNISIVVSDFNAQWVGVISNEAEIDDSKYILYKCFADTKKEVVNNLIESIQSLEWE
jgi:adenine-specific DNA methylase